MALALACATPTVLVTAAIAYLAGPGWWILPASSFVAVMLVLLPYVIAPEATIRFVFRAMYVSDDDARKPPSVP